MSTIVTRSGKGSPLSHVEVDANFTNLNTDKIQSGNTVAALTITSATINGGTITGITDLAIADGGTGASDAATARTNLGLVIGTNVQAYDADLTAIAALAPTADNFIVGNGTAWTLETPAQARTSLGLGTAATVADSTLVHTSGNETISGTKTFSVDASISGLTVGKGGGAVSSNTVVGTNALAVNTTGGHNNAFGVTALNGTTTGNYNNAFGWSALIVNTTGSSNTAMGEQALQANTTASNNTAVGYQAGYTITTGANNSCFGVGAGYGSPVGGTNLTTGNSNTLIGTYAYTSGANDSSSIVIGYNSAGKGGSTGFINPGGGGVYQGNNSTLWSITSDSRLKKNIVDNNTGLDKITAIQVRNFEYRLETEITDLPQNQAIKKEGVQLGVIAQELQQVLPECVKTESNGVMAVDADNLTWYMVNAIKELKAEFDAYKATHP